ncbi:hypothetical protein [Anaerococcus vaginalis]|uniref:hypothetical protein n=1 Tax=Anaerococcus vaginalis TaxID=33037 RepID=UPI0028FFD347|nr:hypothetical protein [Anaerococcus vaginalis]MDU0945013.1 hypothetical protein [Anaerococcus vaginalis]MDU1029899.1 hypothetical protein [Anaerococcus vaginalis]MDU2374555.1 hypothetical protein [Anaerococcus vaginalis]
MDGLENFIKILNFIFLIGGGAVSAYKKVRSTKIAKFYGISEKYFTKIILNNKEDFYYVVFGIIINIILNIFLNIKIGKLTEDYCIRFVLYVLFIIINILIIYITAKNLKYYIALGILPLEGIIIIFYLGFNNIIKYFDIVTYISTIIFISSYIILFFCPKFYYAEYILDYEIITKKNNCSERLVIIQSGSENFIACRFFIKEIEKRTKIRKKFYIEKVLFIEKSKFVFIDPKDYYFENIHFDKVEVLERYNFEKEYYR